jgi:hypothetical protein
MKDLKLGCNQIDGPFTDSENGPSTPKVTPLPEQPRAFSEKDLLHCKGSKQIETVKVIESTDPNAAL